MATESGTSTSQASRLLWRYWFWIGPAELLYLALDRYWGGPEFGERTGFGRFERNPQALLLFVCAAVFALALSAGAVRTRPRRMLFWALCFGAWLYEATFSGISAFGMTMFLLAMACNDLFMPPLQQQKPETAR